MGRNSGAEVFSTLFPQGGSYISIFYCQQHARWDVRIHPTLITAWNKLRAEVKDFHGMEEQ